MHMKKRSVIECLYVGKEQLPLDLLDLNFTGNFSNEIVPHRSCPDLNSGNFNKVSEKFSASSIFATTNKCMDDRFTKTTLTESPITVTIYKLISKLSREKHRNKKPSPLQ